MQLAAAEPAKTAVDKLVRTAIATVAASQLADHAVIDVYGMDESDDLVAVGALRTHDAGGKITRKLDPRGVTVVADDATGAAWFIASYALDIVDTPMDVQEVHTRERVAGLALRTGGHLAARRGVLGAHDAGQGADGSSQPVDRSRYDPHSRPDRRRRRGRPRSPRLVRHRTREDSLSQNLYL